jgi:hypothetical protein
LEVAAFERAQVMEAQVRVFGNVFEREAQEFSLALQPAA